MFTDLVKFKDLDGVDREKKIYFNLNKAEVIRWGMLLPNKEDGSTYETLQEYLEAVIQRNDRFEIVELFDDLIRRSYGVKGSDGVQFVKTEEEYQKFYNSEIYSEFFMKLLTEDGYVQKFINGIINVPPAKS